jgi:hypothetical protein
MVGSSNTPPKEKEKSMITQCSIDWLSVTTKHNRGAITPGSITHSYIEKKGRLGYKSSYVFDNGITHLWSDDRPEVHVIYSGDTLRTVSEIMSIQRLVQWHYDLGHRVSRIDTAIDVFDSEAQVTEFSKLWAGGNVKTRAKSAILISDPKNETGDTFYVGSLKKRRKLLRIYDKAKEQKIDRDWMRFEMQWGAGAARTASKQIAETCSLSDTIKSQMSGYCDFRHKIWRNVFSDVEPISVSNDVPSGVSNTLKWLYETVLPAMVKQEIETPGMVGLFAQMVHDDIDRQNRKERVYVGKSRPPY